jgi:hypothetical protein
MRWRRCVPPLWGSALRWANLPSPCPFPWERGRRKFRCEQFQGYFFLHGEGQDAGGARIKQATASHLTVFTAARAIRRL